MKRQVLIALVLLGASILFFLKSPAKVTTIDTESQTAALYKARATSTLEEEPNDAAVLLAPGTAPSIDTSKLSPTSTDFIHPQERAFPGVPSATTTGAYRVNVVVYHTLRKKMPGKKENAYNVQPANLEKELTYLKTNGFTTITFADIIAARDGKKALPPKPVMLTFDDGLKDHYTVALPLLKRYGMRGVFYIYPNPIVTHNKKWMTWDEVRELDAAGMEIASHTYTHPMLNKIVAPTWEKERPLLDKEIVKSKEVIEKELGKKVLSIAYPFGLYNARTIDAVQRAGYDFGRTISPGAWQDRTHDLEWSAQIMTDNFGLFKRYMESK